MFRRAIRVVTGDEVRRLLPMAACIELMDGALREHARGEVEMPVRLVLNTRDGHGALALMPAHLSSSRLLGYKAVSVYPGTDPAIEPTHQAAVAILEPATGRMLGLVDGTSITEIRTAAVSAVATRELARADASVLTVIGAGAQAAAHLESIGLVRELGAVRIWARDPRRAQALAERAVAAGVAGGNVTAIPEAEAALEGADIVVTATSARRPVVQRSWIAAGTHLNAVGTCIPTAREIDAATVAAARVVVDSRDAALREAGDLLLAIADGAIDETHVGPELGDVLVGAALGRSSDAEITMFESLGLGVEDVTAAAYVLRRAEAVGAGTVVDL